VDLKQSHPDLAILLFPCNQFGGQEPGSAAEIQKFAEAKGVPVSDPDMCFFMMEKVDVNGPSSHAVYQYLKGATKDTTDIKWNFGSYWLVNTRGDVERLEGGKNYPANFRNQVLAASL